MCTLSINPQFNGIELTFATRPDEATRTAMKDAGFRWHGVKKLWYAKNTAERMVLAKKLAETESVPATAAAATRPAAQPAEVVSKYGIKPGDILSASWGYSMTIVEFYKVTKVLSPSKIEIVELGHMISDCDCGGGSYRTPDLNNPIGEPLEKMVSQTSWEKQDGRWHVKINHSISLTLWDGNKKYMNTWD